MRNLLNESFTRLLKNKSFRICLAICIGFPILILGFLKFIFESDGSSVQDSPITASDNLFFMIGMLPIIIAIASGLFIAKDFQQNTVRNKIITGFSRTSIYMTNWITAVFSTILLHVISTVVTVSFTSVIFEPGEIFTKINIYYSLVCIPVLISITSLTVMMTMIFKNTAGAIFSFLVIDLSSLFTLFSNKIENEAFRKFMDLFLPINQLNIIQSRRYYSESEILKMTDLDLSMNIPSGFSAAALPIYALILAAILTSFGIIHFKKSDIK